MNAHGAWAVLATLSVLVVAWFIAFARIVF
ncbi:hypothetical protein R54767_04695 [Paraburkholderia gardini]|uniref:Uncharacterized protein n=1 Tax=Paraburkholderia gardini TaxID=2823469 RepID=A0ABN7QWG4_9BURK|nr:hypothetical protein R54767_04695 [Paraburkholderia gardini]